MAQNLRISNPSKTPLHINSLGRGGWVESGLGGVPYYINTYGAKLPAFKNPCKTPLHINSLGRAGWVESWAGPAGSRAGWGGFPTKRYR